MRSHVHEAFSGGPPVQSSLERDFVQTVLFSCFGSASMTVDGMLFALGAFWVFEACGGLRVSLAGIVIAARRFSCCER